MYCSLFRGRLILRLFFTPLVGFVNGVPFTTRTKINMYEDTLLARVRRHINRYLQPPNPPLNAKLYHAIKSTKTSVGIITGIGPLSAPY